MNNPRWKKVNASIAQRRREKQKADEENRKACGIAYDRGRQSERSRFSTKTYGVQFTTPYACMTFPFEERMTIAKESLATELAKLIINDIDIDHERNLLDREVWTARIPIGKIERIAVYGWGGLR